MAKDFFVDLTQTKPERDDRPERPERMERTDAAEKTIRNVMVNRRTPGPRPIEPRDHQPKPRKSRSGMLWVIAGIIVLGIGSVGIMMATAVSTVVVTPRSHNITFDQNALFTAMPSGSGLSYAVETVTLEEYMTVPAQGTERVEDRATGNITVYNEYSDAPVRLIKNTRFESPAGLVYRIPASVVVPGKKGSTPGEVTVTVIADSAGPEYNTGSIEKLTVPGLKTTPAMFAGVYARAPQGMSGGFVGERPAVPTDALESARAGLRTVLAGKLKETQPFERQDAFVLVELAELSYEHLATSPDPAGAKVGEKLVARIPVFSKPVFAAAIAQAVSADAGSSPVSLRPGAGFTVSSASTTASALGGPLGFRIAGSASLVWDVDVASLKNALLGKEKDAFKPIVAQFPGIEKADADVAPIWSSRFPTQADKLEISVADPAQTP